MSHTEQHIRDMQAIATRTRSKSKINQIANTIPIAQPVTPARKSHTFSPVPPVHSPATGFYTPPAQIKFNTTQNSAPFLPLYRDLWSNQVLKPAIKPKTNQLLNYKPLNFDDSAIMTEDDYANEAQAITDSPLIDTPQQVNKKRHIEPKSSELSISSCYLSIYESPAKPCCLQDYIAQQENQDDDLNAAAAQKDSDLSTRQYISISDL